ncbi:ShKT domain-containing protein [Caenorhabditis elegans]|uniref:ShKT domain-containing protein n=1 Tax=Caenorhabditis elegans TaxID=6239 RepID=Q7YTR5_CAEEL|nr:ShKT domain-containing protein [Caenorhabditis elegans]CAE17709.1 ShKT domain-containing protein [Caenorhabditis elegans]|eukprot:NP_001023684.1 Uncharacterized protein CELE_C27A7.9 [Caenorhabditis elegans]
MCRLTILVLSAVLFAAVHSQNCTWSNWAAWTTCSDSCGNCGNQTRARSCSSQTASCICTGNTTELQTCNNDVCIFPRKSCCSGQPASLQGFFKCS